MSWYLEMNQFADRTPEEFSVRKGLRADRSRRRSRQGGRRQPRPRGEVPDFMDWNAEGAVRYNFYTIYLHSIFTLSTHYIHTSFNVFTHYVPTHI